MEPLAPVIELLREALPGLQAVYLFGSRATSEASPTDREFFEAYALADYARQNEDRRGILEEVRKRGSIHG